MRPFRANAANVRSRMTRNGTFDGGGRTWGASLHFQQQPHVLLFSCLKNAPVGLVPVHRALMGVEPVVGHAAGGSEEDATVIGVLHQALHQLLEGGKLGGNDVEIQFIVHLHYHS